MISLALEKLLNRENHLDYLEVDTYDQVTDDDGRQEEGDAGHVTHVHAVPHRLDPLATEHPKHYHEGMHEVGEVPPGQFAARESVDVVRVVFAEELHAHHGEDEDDDAQDERQVT